MNPTEVHSIKSVWSQKSRKLRPRWVKYYRIAAYLTFALNLVTVFGYLIYLGLILNERKMYMPYAWFIKFHEMNSYSLLSPFLAFPIVAVLSYHVKYRKNLSDGDFLGILGVVLLMAGLSVYEGTKLIYTNIDLVEIINGGDSNNTISIEKNQNEILDIFDLFNKSASSIEMEMDWTKHLQRELKCCGAHGKDDWIKFNRSKSPLPSSCCSSCPFVYREDETNMGMNKKKCNCTEKDSFNQGCAIPIWNYLIKINTGTVICMFLLAFAYLLTMTAYTFHWAAMQLENADDEDNDELPRQTSLNLMSELNDIGVTPRARALSYHVHYPHNSNRVKHHPSTVDLDEFTEEFQTIVPVKRKHGMSVAGVPKVGSNSKIPTNVDHKASWFWSS